MNFIYTGSTSENDGLEPKIGFYISNGLDEIKNINVKSQVEPDEEVREDVRDIFPISRNYSRDKNKKKYKNS